MNTTLKPDRYHPLSIGMHWLMLALLVAVYALIELRGIFPKGTTAYDAMKTWHFMLGLSVLVLVLARIALRFRFPTPAITPAPPRWQQALAVSMHLAIYAFLVVMPLLGWLTLSAKGRVIPFFGLDLPPLIGVDRGLAGSLEDLHELIGVIGYWIFGLHAAAALVHHYLMRDDTLRRMLPGSSGR
jgi:cytochrome b561